MPPNILILMVDQLTALVLRGYGGAVCGAPNLDALAARGILFEPAVRGSLIIGHPGRRTRAAPGAPARGAPPSAGAAEARLRLVVPDIHCQAWVARIRAGLVAEGSARSVDGDPEAKTVEIVYAPAVSAPEGLEGAIARLGFRVERPEKV